ncbi:von Willebrand factor type A domain-containing protein [uncultured Tenacibaculum sp.]|uniref:vWA domain-containing protein n=1 Tax=uncultured Tenacibaculum sp. TaxID=174713 RepID=UPI00261772B1|nr:von Willebrand factor type A domain-containing protein [uncultured Tenacibaculum sp.]
MKKIIQVLILILYIPGTFAQQKEISGVVSDDKNVLPFVNVLIKGSNKITTTNIDGKYIIKATKGDVLVFSSVGYETEERKVHDSSIINVTMRVSEIPLEEVVVVEEIIEAVEYEEAEPVEYLSVSSPVIKRDKVNGRRTNVAKSALYALSNKNTKIKGTSNLNTNEEPLYIVDGVIIEGNSNKAIQNIDPNKIKSVNVLKFKEAQSLYGAAAKNGCVIITTKAGNYNVENNEEYKEIQENHFENVTLSPLSTFSIDVDKASYSNIRRMINKGNTIPTDAVKIEEMINYFDYDYPQPKGEHPFAITTEVVKTPWNAKTKLVRIGLQGKKYEQEELPASNLTFLIDVSGSMRYGSKLPLLKRAFKLLVNQLRAKDKVSIVVYAGAAGVVLEPTSGDKKEKILNALDNLRAGGSTAGGEGIKLAYKLAEKNFKRKGNNRVILATDGDFNVGASSDKAMQELIEEKRKTGVFLSVLGFGYGNYKDSKLETLADKGNGNHAYIDTMQEAQKVFGKEFGGTLYTIAKDVKIQVEFNPKKVQAYRLIGYENRLLNDEDFVDDTKDAGELGSNHNVTALYEVIPVGVKSEYLKNIPDLKYTKTVVNDYKGELLTVKFRYKKPSGTKSIELVKTVKDREVSASNDMSFVSAVALFGMHLRKSQYKSDSKIEDVIALGEKGRGKDEEGFRGEFVRLVKAYVSTN